MTFDLFVCFSNLISTKAIMSCDAGVIVKIRCHGATVITRHPGRADLICIHVVSSRGVAVTVVASLAGCTLSSTGVLVIKVNNKMTPKRFPIPLFLTT